MSNFVDITGHKFGKLTVISRTENIGRRVMWNCICDCGELHVACSSNLKNGTIKSCGCLCRDYDLTNHRFGKLLAVSYAKGGKWDCICDCGKTHITSSQNLRNGRTKSCGCSPKYNKLIDETLAAKHVLFLSYKKGAKKRGHSFSLSFEEFINSVQKNCFYCGEKPSQCCRADYAKNFYYNGLDRIDNDKGYEILNIIPCCFKCNRAKLKRSKEEFIAWVKKCYNNLNLK